MSSDEESALLIDENQCNENNVGPSPLADITAKPGVDDSARKTNADLNTPQVHEHTNGHNTQLNLESQQEMNNTLSGTRRRRALSLDYDILRDTRRQTRNITNLNNNENHDKKKDRTTSHKKRHKKHHSRTNGDKNHHQNRCKSPVQSSASRSLFSSKTQSIRFPQNINEKKHVLNLTVPKHQFYNLKFSRLNGGLVFTLPVCYPPPIPLGEIKFEQLLYWPGVSLLINVEHLQVEHKVHPNIKRQIVMGSDPLIELPTEANPNEIKHLLNNVQADKKIFLSKQAICDYMPALLAAGSIYDIPASRLNELSTAFDVIKKDVELVPFEEIELKSIHAMCLNKYQYVRCFPHDTTDREPITMREIINPEVNFSFKKSTFTECGSWIPEMEEYVNDMFVTRAKAFGDTLRDRLKKCFTLRCDYCYSSFDGPLASFSLAAHMKDKHYFAKNWTCINCRQSWPHIELLSMKWQHNCEQTTRQNERV